LWIQCGLFLKNHRIKLMFKWLFGHHPSDEEQALKDDYLLDSVATKLKKKPDPVVKKSDSKKIDKILHDHIYYNPVNNQVYFTSFHTIEDIDLNVVAHIYDGFDTQRIIAVGGSLGDIYNTWKIVSNSDYANIYNKLSDEDKIKFKNILHKYFTRYIKNTIVTSEGAGYYVLDNQFVSIYKNHYAGHSKFTIVCDQFDLYNTNLDVLRDNYINHIVNKVIKNDIIIWKYYTHDDFNSKFKKELIAYESKKIIDRRSEYVKTVKRILSVHKELDKWLVDNGFSPIIPITDYNTLSLFYNSIKNYSAVLTEPFVINIPQEPDFELFVESYFYYINNQ